MNETLLREVQKAIRKWPEGFDMRSMGEHFKFDPSKEPAPTCGSAACIAGWAALLGRQRRLTTYESMYRIEDAAIAELDLDEETAEKLFYPSSIENWDVITPEHACKVIDNLIETGKVDWEAVIEEPTDQEKA